MMLVVNPLASRTFRTVASLLLLAPLIAWLVALTADIEFGVALVFTLYVWTAVAVVLVTIALLMLLGRISRWAFGRLRRRMSGRR